MLAIVFVAAFALGADVRAYFAGRINRTIGARHDRVVTAHDARF
jgi:hypothetical protein